MRADTAKGASRAQAGGSGLSDLFLLVCRSWRTHRRMDAANGASASTTIEIVESDPVCIVVRAAIGRQRAPLIKEVLLLKSPYEIR